MNANQLEQLKKATFSHLSEKRYVFRPRKPQMGKNRRPLKDKDNNIVYSSQYYDPTPSKTVLLSFAFNIALENYRNIRPSNKIKIISKLSELSEMMVRFFSNKYYNRIEDINEKNELIKSSQNYEYEALERFRKIEYKLYGMIDRLRNYHSHYIHEPGVLTFKDLFETDNSTLSQEDFDEAKAWFKKRFDDAHSHLRKSLLQRLEKIEALLNEENISENKKALYKKVHQINRVIERFDNIQFLQDSALTQLGQLFIATIFLTKRQAKIVLDKWRGLKDVEGYENTLHTFFTYYSIRERYSINNYNDDLLKFRNICSRLSTVAKIENDHLDFIYKKIQDINQDNWDKLDKLPPNSKSKNVTNKRNELQKKIIPIRKREIFSEVLLQYVLDNDLLKDSRQKDLKVRIAIKKTPTDKLKYYEEHPEIDEKESLTELKNRITNETDLKKRKVLLAHFKELKRNFVFRTPEELKQMLVKDEDDELSSEIKGYRFSIKKRNVLLEMNIKGAKINVTLSPDFLLKWVFLHLEEQADNVLKILSQYVSFQYYKRKYNSPDEIISLLESEYEHVSIKKMIPRSVREVVGLTKHRNIRTKTKIKIESKLDQLNSFISRNANQAKPWQYASKRKIDIIINYLQFRLLEDVYINHLNGTEDETAFIRHTALNMNTFNIAREYFRFFGRYENATIHELDEYVMPEVIFKMKDEHSILFGYIKDEIRDGNSLEELYEKVVIKQVKFLSKYLHQINELSDEVLMKIFKVDSPSDLENISSQLKKMFSNSIEVSPDLLSIRKEMPSAWNEFTNGLEKKGKVIKNYSEYAFIRNYLSQKDNPATNVDFILRHILPEIPKVKDKNRKISKVFNLLLKQKTKELLLWSVAKHYWQKANRKSYDTNNLVTNRESAVFQEFCTFTKVYCQDLDFEITIDKNFWGEKNQSQFKFVYGNLPQNNKNLKFSIKVPARKYDNKFILYEAQLIREYMLWHHFDKKQKRVVQNSQYRHRDRNIKQIFDLNIYEDVIKLVYKELIYSIFYIGALLRAEKKIIDKNPEKFMSLMDRKYKAKKMLSDYYLSIRNKEDEPENYELYKMFLEQEKIMILDDKSIKQNRSFEDYLISFRNFALHYQLQDPYRMKRVMKILGRINRGLDENEFVSIE